MKEWIDRNWNLFFNHKACTKIDFDADWNYNDILVTHDNLMWRTLGKGWFKLMKTKINKHDTKGISKPQGGGQSALRE